MTDSLTQLAYCPYCYPEKTNHRQEKLNSFLIAYVTRPASYLIKCLTINKTLYFTDRYLIMTIILLRKCHKIQIHQEINPEQTSTRLKLLWGEAKKRGLDIYRFSMYNRQLMSFLLVYHGKQYYFHYSPTTLLHKHHKQYQDPTLFDDKYKFKKTLMKNKLPCPEGRVFFSTRKAFQYGKRLGYPLVVKPASSTFSHHVSLNINDDLTLKKAIEIAKIIDCRVVVERFIEGDVHRMMVIGDQFVVCSKRTRACIMGDGQSTISALIDQFNGNPLRGKIDQIGFSLYQIEKTKSLEQYLHSLGFSLNMVLEHGKQIFLSEKSNCSNGAEVGNVTEEVCAENAMLFRKLTTVLGIGVSAVDFICKDVSQPWHTQPFAFLENNSFPAIDPQHFPSSGKPVDVASTIWDFVLHQLDKLPSQ